MSELDILEETLGLRMSWNVWPRTNAAKCVVPFAVFYTPTKVIPNLKIVHHTGVPCKYCGAFLNPFVPDLTSVDWLCPFCGARNLLYGQDEACTMNNSQRCNALPCHVVEYVLPKPKVSLSQTFIFVIDICTTEDELTSCKELIVQMLQFMPKNGRVGLITFGTHVYVHELGCMHCEKIHVLKGTREKTVAEVRDRLNLGMGTGRPWEKQVANISRMIVHYNTDSNFMNRVENLSTDRYRVQLGRRPLRCTGTAVHAATVLASSLVPGQNVSTKIVLFVSGAATIGPGKIVSSELSDAIRCHRELSHNDVPYFGKAVKFYTQLSEDLNSADVTLNCFVCSPEQAGLAELKTAVERSGGITLLCDSFRNIAFK
jgi:protein transport protein SEC23